MSSQCPSPTILFYHHPLFYYPFHEKIFKLKKKIHAKIVTNTSISASESSPKYFPSRQTWKISDYKFASDGEWEQRREEEKTGRQRRGEGIVSGRMDEEREGGREEEGKGKKEQKKD